MCFMDFLSQNAPGRLKIGTLLFLSLFGACIHLGFQLAPYWINASELKEFMTERARTAELSSDQGIQTAIISKAEELGIPLTDSDVRVERSLTEIVISTSWELDYTFFGLYSHTFTFSPQVTMHFR